MSTSILTKSNDFVGTGRTEDQRSDLLLPRGEGYAALVAEGNGHENRIVNLVQRSPLRVLFPVVEGIQASEAVLINTGGGTTGGDQFEYRIDSLPGSSLAVTTQAAEKIYKAISIPARVTTKLEVNGGARLAWLPQETIVFNQARLRRATSLNVIDDAEVLVGEMLVLGRKARRERLDFLDIQDCWRVSRAGRLIWADTFRLDGGSTKNLQLASLLGHFSAVATFVYVGPSIELMHSSLRGRSNDGPDSATGVTVVNGVLLVRILAMDSSVLRHEAMSIIEVFQASLGPGPFKVPKMWNCS